MVNKKVNIAQYNECFALKDMVNMDDFSFPLSAKDKYKLEQELTREHNLTIDDYRDEVRYVIDQDDNQRVFQLNWLGASALPFNVRCYDPHQKLIALRKPVDPSVKCQPTYQYYVDDNGEQRRRLAESPKRQFGYRNWKF